MFVPEKLRGAEVGTEGHQPAEAEVFNHPEVSGGTKDGTKGHEG
jgi:hypothetical protein